MLRFFRHIRRDNTGNSNLQAYIWYAIGEVFLVILGILIALQINNWNESRKQQQSVESILEGLQTDLVSDIREAHSVMAWYDARENVIIEMLEGNQPHDNNSPSIYSSGMFWNPFVMNSGSFELLNANKDIISQEFQDILKRLNSQYIQTGALIETRQKYIDDHLNRYRNHLVDNEDWFADYQLNNYTEEVTDYILNSELHRRKLIRFLDLSEGMRFVLRQFVQQATYNYVLIHNLLNKQEDYSKYIELPDLELSNAKGKGLPGIYFEDEYQTEIRIQKFNNVFSLIVDTPQLIDSEPYLLIDLPGDTLGNMINPTSFLVIQRNDRNNVTGIEVYQGNGLQAVLNKIE